MDGERFCNRCGADNGQPEPSDAGQVSADPNAVGIQGADLPFIAHMAAVVMFAVAALIMLITCWKQAGSVSAQSVLYTGTSLFAIPYFVLGMWSAVPALMFLLNIKSRQTTSVTGAAVVMVIVMIAVCIIAAIFIKSTGFMKIFGITAAVYRTRAVTIIVLGVLTAALGMASPRLTR